MNIFEEIKYNFRQKENGLIQIILINVIVFVILGIFSVLSRIGGFSSFFDAVYLQLALPADLASFATRPWSILTYFFTHSMTDIFHILFNMLFLYWFGKIIYEYIGNRRFINLYLMGGLIGGIIFLFIFNVIPYYAANNLSVSLVGASGAVFAVVVGAATLVPHYRFNLIFLGSVKITYIAAFFVFTSWLGSIGGNAGGSICHLGGALFGFLYIQQLRKGRDLGKPINVIASFINRIGKPKLKVSYKAKSNKTNTTSSSNTGEPTQDEIDKILDKISKGGYGSLTKIEKQKLFKASGNK